MGAVKTWVIIIVSRIIAVTRFFFSVIVFHCAIAAISKPFKLASKAHEPQMVRVVTTQVEIVCLCIITVGRRLFICHSLGSINVAT